jgi:pimeloyl-ACP methyl ester carboxylesterase
VKLRLAAIAVAVVLLVLLVNAFLVTRTERPAAAFAGGRVLQLEGPDLNVREYGPPGARAVVLLHGYSASIEWWEKVAPVLADTGQRVVAIDLVGHGGSEAPRDAEQYGAAGQATAVRRALDALGVRRAVLVGHSMGGHVATAVAERDPDVVERVVVSDSFADQGLVDRPALGGLACWPVVGQAVDRFRGVDAITDSSLQAGFASDYPVPDLAHRSLEQLTYRGLCDSDAGDELNRERAVADRLAGLDKPVLVVWGERDALTPTAENVARYRAAGLDPRVIAVSGHSPMVETPDSFVAAITDFIRPAADQQT